MKEQEGKGSFHSIWTFKTPFIGAMCVFRNLYPVIPVSRPHLFR